MKARNLFLPRMGVILLFGLILAGCALYATRPNSTQAPMVRARQALEAYFNNLAAGRYTEAAALYGGDYQVLADNNPDLDFNDHAAMFQNACQVNGFVCNLAIKNYVSESQPSENEFVFVVEFQTADGALFTLGPCCGADPTESPPVTQFEYHVQKVNGKYLVMDLPVYRP
jgi:hypothetical protein